MKVWNVVRNWKRLAQLLEDEQERLAHAEFLFSRIKTEGLQCEPVLGNPASDIGAALQLAEKWHLRLLKGTCYGDCRVILDEEHWLNPLNENVPSWNYGTFTLQEPKDVHSIYEVGRDLPMAICICLLNARTAGVI